MTLRDKMVPIANRLRPSYTTKNGHTIKRESENLGSSHYSHQYRTEYVCQECGESHTDLSFFSDSCDETGSDYEAVEEVEVFVSIVSNGDILFKTFDERNLIPVSIHDKNQDEEVRDTLENTKEGEAYKLTLIVTNPEGTEYYCSEIDKINDSR